MTVSEMHIMFRTLGQQMGLQNIRTILAESIDVYLNWAQDVFVDTTIQRLNLANADINNNRSVIADSNVKDNSVPNVNAFRNLTNIITVPIIGGYDKVLNTHRYSIDISNIDARNFIDFSINYKGEDEIHHTTRFIEIDKVNETIRDYANRVTREEPIVSIINNKLLIFVLEGLVPTTVEITYLQNTKPISFSNNVDCKLLPQYHINVVDMAVNRFFNSLKQTQ